MLRHPLPICFRMPFHTSASHISNLRCAVEWYEKLVLPPAVPYVSVEHCFLLFWALSVCGLDSANYFTYFFWCLGNSRELDWTRWARLLAAGHARVAPFSSPAVVSTEIRPYLVSSPLPADTMGITVLLQSPLKSPGEGDMIKDMIRQPYHKTGAVLLVIHSGVRGLGLFWINQRWIHWYCCQFLVQNTPHEIHSMSAGKTTRSWMK